MSKRIRLIVVLALGLLALCILPAAVSAAAPHKTETKTTAASFAFTGLITQGAGKGLPITGGLTLNIRSDRFFNGNLHLPESTQISTSGYIRNNGTLTITFFDVKGMALIKGEGKPTASGDYTGPFHAFNGGKEIASGVWAARPVAPSKVLALAFAGAVVSGTSKGTEITGAIVLDSSTLKGYLLTPTDAALPVVATLSNGGKNINVVFAGGAIVGTGTLTKNPLNGLNKGYTGPFKGPASNDVGQWAAFFFTF